MMRNLSLAGCGLAGCAGLAVMAPAAHAEVTASASTALRYDDNVFALPADDQPAGLHRSDTVYTGNGELDAVFKPGGYTLDLAAGASYEGYARNSTYNNFGYAIELSSTPPVDRTVAVGGHFAARRQLSSFASLGLPVRDVQTLVDLAPEVAVKLAGELVVTAMPVYTRSTNTAALFDAYSYERYGGSFGFGWHTPLGNRIDLTFTDRETRGLGDRLIQLSNSVIDQPTNLRDRSVDVRLHYQITPITSVNATASYVWRHDRTVLAHTFSAPFGEVGAKFEPSERLRITANIGWRLETVDELFVDSVRTAYAGVTGTMLLGSHWRLSGRFDYNRRKFEADQLALVNSYSLGVADRSDHFYRGEAALTYGISNRFAVAANFAHESRDSTYHFANFRENIAQISLIYSFGAHPETLTNTLAGQVQ